jgi:hypothetical protein
MKEGITIRILEKNPKGLSITEQAEISRLSRHCTGILIARLEGAGKVYMGKAGMAKLYCFLNKKEGKK